MPPIQSPSKPPSSAMAGPAFAAALFGLGASAGFSAVAAFERELVYHPGRGGLWRDVAPPPPWRRIALRDDDVDVFGWALDPAPGAATVLWLHGNADSPEGLRPVAERVSAGGAGAFLLSYRGYAGNPGRPSEAGLIADAAAALDWLRREGAVDVVVAGHSLGSGVAAGLAERAARQGEPVAALLLLAPFTDLASVAEWHVPLLPVRLLMRERYDTLERLRGLEDLAVLVVHGDRDEIVPVSEGRALAAALGERARLHLVEGAGHAPFAPAALAEARRFVEVAGAERRDEPRL